MEAVEGILDAHDFYALQLKVWQKPSHTKFQTIDS